MQVLFLDIDGVLNSAQSAHMYKRERDRAKAGEEGWLDALGRRALREDEFCPIACSNLLDILDIFPNLKIVVSSSWRLGRKTGELQIILMKAGIPADRVIGRTPHINGAQRGTEIHSWLQDHPSVENFVVVGDDRDMDAVEDNLVQTRWETGLDWFAKQAIIKKLSEKP